MSVVSGYLILCSMIPTLVILILVTGIISDNDTSVDFATLVSSEERCVEKVVMQEETEWDQQIECHHRFRVEIFIHLH